MFSQQQIDKVLKQLDGNIVYHRLAIKLIEEIRRNEQQKQASVNDNDKKKA
jgi:hypothetical protein